MNMKAPPAIRMRTSAAPITRARCRSAALSTRSYVRFSHSNEASKVLETHPVPSPWSGRSIREVSMGVSVSATNPEISTATASVMPNSLKRRPTVPWRKATGTNTATREIVVARIANPISFEPSRAACRRVFLISRWR